MLSLAASDVCYAAVQSRGRLLWDCHVNTPAKNINKKHAASLAVYPFSLPGVLCVDIRCHMSLLLIRPGVNCSCKENNRKHIIHFHVGNEICIGKAYTKTTAAVSDISWEFTRN